MNVHCVFVHTVCVLLRNMLIGSLCGPEHCVTNMACVGLCKTNSYQGKELMIPSHHMEVLTCIDVKRIHVSAKQAYVARWSRPAQSVSVFHTFHSAVLLSW